LAGCCPRRRPLPLAVFSPFFSALLPLLLLGRSLASVAAVGPFLVTSLFRIRFRRAKFARQRSGGRRTDEKRRRRAFAKKKITAAVAAAAKAIASEETRATISRQRGRKASKQASNRASDSWLPPPGTKQL